MIVIKIELAGKIAIVSGVAQGMGRAIAQQLFALEATVVGLDKSDGSSCFSEEISTGRFVFKQIDICNREAVKELVAATGETYGSIDILVNNAGILERSLFENMTQDHWERVLDVNLVGMMNLCQAVIPFMKKQQRGKIINASSILGGYPDVGLTAYSISKASVNTLTKILAAELGPYNIQVNAYAPGTIITPMTEKLRRERAEQKLKQIPLRRFGEAEEVAYAVAFLASSFADYISGAILPVDGASLVVQRPDAVS
ncbi:MAG: 3-oxoacyl-ACP reductase FabG [Alcaligenaceae bacterium]|nr:3-oxoacyl-ACP reductase FabG [Alcaligenaceae bacterium]